MRQIRLLKYYQSLSMALLEPGIYPEDDPRLKGHAAYLVENGHAEWLDTPPTLQDIDAALYGTDPTPEETAWIEPETPVDSDAEKEWLQGELDRLEIPYDRRWGVERLRMRLEEGDNG